MVSAQLKDRIRKLPQWVQRYIAKLEQDVEYWTAQYEVAEAGDSPIQWTTGIGESRGLPDVAKVAFIIGDGMKIMVALRRGRVRASAYSGQLTIEPEASNSVFLDVKRY